MDVGGDGQRRPAMVRPGTRLAHRLACVAKEHIHQAQWQSRHARIAPVDALHRREGGGENRVSACLIQRVAGQDVRLDLVVGIVAHQHARNRGGRGDAPWLRPEPAQRHWRRVLASAQHAQHLAAFVEVGWLGQMRLPQQDRRIRRERASRLACRLERGICRQRFLRAPDIRPAG